MSVSAGSVYLDVGFNVPKIGQDLAKAGKAAADKAAPEIVKSFDQKLTSISKKAESVGKKMTVGLSLPVAAGLTLATKKASDLEQAVGGTGAVFGAQQAKLTAFAKGAADSVGLSEQAARTFTTQIGAALKGYGFSVDAAADKSIQLTQLGADLAATFGGTTADAVTALSAALRGEFDPLERFGVAINQTLIDQKAVTMGLAQNTANVSQNARAQAALALITQRSADAQGQFGRESGSAAGAAQIAAAKAENAAADLGQAFLPIYTKLSQATGAVAQKFQSLPDSAQSVAAGVGVVAVAAGPAILGLGKIGGAVAALRKSMSEGSLAADSFGRKLAGFTAAAATGAAIGSGIGEHITSEGQDSASALFGNINFADINATAKRLTEIGQQVNANARRWNEYNTAEQAAHFQERQNLDVATNQLEEYQKFQAENINRAGQLARALGISGEQAKQMLVALNVNPSMVDMTKLVDVAKRYKAGVIGAADATAELTGNQAKAAPAAQSFAEKLSSARQAAGGLVSGFMGLVDAQKNYTNSVKAISDAQRAASDAARKVLDAQRAVGDAVRKVGDAQRTYQESVRGVADAQRQYQDSLRAVTDAERQRQASLRGVEAAQRAVVDAQTALNDALRGPSEDQSISLARAQIALKEAEKRSHGPFDNTLDRQSAQLDVRQAKADLLRLQNELAQAVPNAQANLTSAQQSLADAQQQSIDAARGVTDAQRAVADSANGIADAQRAVADSARGVTDAQRDVADAQRAVSDAQRDAADANAAVVTAQGEAAKAALELNAKTAETNQLFKDQRDAIDPAIASLQAAMIQYPQAAAALQPLIDKMKELRDLTAPQDQGQRALADLGKLGISGPFTPEGALKQIIDMALRLSGTSGPISLDEAEKILGIKPRAAGGPVTAGQMYRHNEKGPEMFVGAGGRQYMMPDVNGRIIPADKVAVKAGTTVVNNFMVLDYNEGLLAAKTERINARQLTGRPR